MLTSVFCVPVLKINGGVATSYKKLQDCFTFPKDMITVRSFRDMFKNVAFLKLEEDKVYTSQEDDALPH
jgi:spore maturation protein CgeB